MTFDKEEGQALWVKVQEKEVTSTNLLFYNLTVAQCNKKPIFWRKEALT